MRTIVMFVLGSVLSLTVIALAVIDPTLPTSAAPPRAALLRVTISPVLPTQVILDGHVADSGGLSWLKVSAGTHFVCFSHVEGWTEPACQIVEANNGAITPVTAEFTQRGSLRVVTSPGVPSQITVDGNPADDWAMWTDLPTGPHRVCFGKVRGYDPPTCQDVTLRAGAQTEVTGKFTVNRRAVGQSGVGLLRATTSPSLPSQLLISLPGANQYIADSWGLNGLELAPGTYTVIFTHVQGFIEPSPRQITIAPGSVVTVVGTFTKAGNLRVLTWPPAPGTILVDGVPRDDWSLSTDFPVGIHTVCFGPAAGFSTTPACQNVTVSAGTSTTITGMYGYG